MDYDQEDAALEQRLRDAQRQVDDVGDRLSTLHDVRSTGWSQHRLARAVVSGPGRVDEVWIDPEAVETYDAESIALLVLDAIRNGYADLDALVESRAQEMLAASESAEADLDSPRR